MSLSPKEMMQYTQALRLRQVEKLTEAGLPSDPKDIATLAALLRDCDNTAASTIKLDIDDRAVDVASETSKNVLEIFKTMGADPFRVDNFIEGEVLRVKQLTTAVRLPEIAVVPGQTHQGVEELNYDDFLSSEG